MNVNVFITVVITFIILERPSSKSTVFITVVITFIILERPSSKSTGVVLDVCNQSTNH